MRNLVADINNFFLNEIYPALILLTFFLVGKMIIAGEKANILNQNILEPPSSLILYFLKVYIISCFFGTIPLFSLFIFACICYTTLMKDRYLLESLMTIDFFVETSLQKTIPVLIDVSVISLAALGLLTGITFYHYTFERMLCGNRNGKYKKQILQLILLSFSLLAILNYIIWGICNVSL
ncbi:MAG: hypothetical protein ACE5K4_03045 [Candidatus Hydrothermarchaeota archaeon]